MVEKMKLLHITGPKEDIDRVADQYLSKYDIHFENALTSLSTLSNVRPFVETNVYKDAYSKAKTLWEYLKEEPVSDLEKITPKEAEQIVDTVYTLAEEILKKQEELKQQRLSVQKLMEQIEPFRDLDYDFKKILEFHYIDFRFGRISRDYYQKLEKYFHDTDYALFYECQSNENYVWGVYFVPKTYTIEVDAVCLSFHFERLYIPDSFEGTPDSAYVEAEEALKKNSEEKEKLEQCLQDTVRKHLKKIQSAYATLDSYCSNFEIRKLAVCTKGRRRRILHFIRMDEREGRESV